MTGQSENDQIRLALVERSLVEIRRDLLANTKMTADLLDAWNSSKFLLKTIFLIAKVSTALVAIVVAIKVAINWPWTP